MNKILQQVFLFASVAASIAIASRAAHADRTEPMIQADFDISNKNGVVTYSPKLRNASACVMNARGRNSPLPSTSY